MDDDCDNFELPDDLKDDVEIVYSDGEDDAEHLEDMVEAIGLTDVETVEVVDLSRLTFDKHTKSVFCCQLSGDGKLAATGGEDDVAYVWRPDTGDVLFECTGHKDSVTEVAFNHNNQYVATADMAGMIQVWDVAEKKLVWCHEGEDLEWMFWHPRSNVLLAGFRTGDAYVWQIPQGILKVLPSSGGYPTTCGRLLPDGRRLLVGHEDGGLRLWDVRGASTAWQSKQNRAITAIEITTDGALAVISPGAQLVKIADGKTVTALLADEEQEIEAALFDNDSGLVVTGGISGHLCVWELGRQSLRHQARIECAVTVLKWGKNGKVFVGGADGAVYVCDVKSGALLETLTGHRGEILSVAVFGDGAKILTASDDGTAKIFDVKP